MITITIAPNLRPLQPPPFELALWVRCDGDHAGPAPEARVTASWTPAAYSTLVRAGWSFRAGLTRTDGIRALCPPCSGRATQQTIHDE